MHGRIFSPDGRFFVDWLEDPFPRNRAFFNQREFVDHVCVWNAATGRAVATLAAGVHGGTANAAFAPDGRTFATASLEGGVQLWETATWTVRTELRGHQGRVTAIAFGSDGRLFTGGVDTVVFGWDVRPPRSLAKGNLADAWEALADPDGQAGFRAQARFLAEPGKATAWIAVRITPAARLDRSNLKGLIADLDNEDFDARERASAQLKTHWPATAIALGDLIANPPTLEARRRAEIIVRDMETVATPPGSLRPLRAVEILEWIWTKEAHAHLRALAKGDPDAVLTRDASAAVRRLAKVAK
jgi:hypothetical protein